MTTTVTRPPEPGDGPLPFVFDVHAVNALAVEPDHQFGLVAVRLASEPKAAILVAPENALLLAQRLVGAVAALRRPPEGRP